MYVWGFLIIANRNMNNIQSEKQELDLLLDKGINIEVEQEITKRSFFWKKTVETKKLVFTIYEPTLSTLDRIASEQIDLVIDENVINSEVGMQEAKRLVPKHCRRMAKILALSILGNEYVIQKDNGKYIKNEKRLKELTELLFNNITPSKLFKYFVLVNTMSNIGDFINSIRLMSAARTTMPNRVEENTQD